MKTLLCILALSLPFTAQTRNEILYGVAAEDHCRVYPAPEPGGILYFSPFWGAAAITAPAPDGSYLAILPKGEKVRILGVPRNGKGYLISLNGVQGVTQCVKELEYVVPPQPLYTPNPAYTYSAAHYKVRGTVTLHFTVTANGNTQDVEVVKGLNVGLDANAVAAVEDWRFAPATREGKPVAMPLTVTVEFNVQ
jgi:TonB family protein